MLPSEIGLEEIGYARRKEVRAWNSLTYKQKESLIDKSWNEAEAAIAKKWPRLRIADWGGILYSGPRKFDVMGRHWSDYQDCRDACLYAKEIFKKNGVLTHRSYCIEDDKGYGFGYGNIS